MEKEEVKKKSMTEKINEGRAKVDSTISFVNWVRSVINWFRRLIGK